MGYNLLYKHKSRSTRNHIFFSFRFQKFSTFFELVLSEPPSLTSFVFLSSWARHQPQVVFRRFLCHIFPYVRGAVF